MAKNARERLLRAAAELFYSDGVGATGIDHVTARAGVAKMSLYNNFASKAELVSAYLDGRRIEWEDLLQVRLAGAKTPRARVLAVFDSYIDHAHRTYGRSFRGCGLLNAAAELPVGETGRAAVAAQKADVERLFRVYLGELRPDAASLDETAAHLSYLLEGAMARAGLDGHDGRLKQARRLADDLIDRL